MRHEYELLKSDTYFLLSALVTGHLADGWDLWGNPFALEAEFDAEVRNIHYFQAVVRLVEEDRGRKTEDRAESEKQPAGFTVLVPMMEEQVPTIEGYRARCTCLELDGDDPQCRIHAGVNIGRVA
jgi:hypothetical protein